MMRTDTGAHVAAGGHDDGGGTGSAFYILHDTRWPEEQATLTWSFNDSTFPADGTREETLGLPLSADYREAIRDAMDAWEAVCGVRFVEVEDSPDAGLRIGWLKEELAALPAARAWWWPDGNGETWKTSIGFDPGASWTSASFYDIALHELGHVLGIDHSDTRDTVMSGPPHTPYANVNPDGRDALTADDIAAARVLWGPPPSPQVGTDGNDDLYGEQGDDTIHGRDGGDRIRGRDGGDDLDGEAGDDTLWGQDGDDTLSGGDGSDRLLGGAGNDRVSGDSGNDRLWGEDGDDTLEGGDGVDILYGMDGNDAMDGGHDRDTILGGAGDDLIRGDFGDSDDGVGEQGDGDDAIWGEAGNDTIRGQGGNDFLSGGIGDDRIHGGGGQDYLSGGTGDDWLYGEDGTDYLAGESGDDFLDGGSGYNTLVGGLGDDTLVGGTEGGVIFGQGGVDHFEYNGGRVWLMDWDRDDTWESANGAHAVDRIQLGEHARVDMSDGGVIHVAWTAVSDLDFV